MKTKRSFLVVAVVAVITCVCASQDRDPVLREGIFDLFAGPDPALAAIDRLKVVIVALDDKVVKDGLNRKELKAKVQNRLTQAGVEMSTGPDEPGGIDSADMAELKVYADMLNLEDTGCYVFRVQVALARNVHLKERYTIKADVWKAKPVMDAVAVKAMPEKVGSIVLDQVDEFTRAYLAAKAGLGRAADSGNPKTQAAGIAGAVAAPSKSTQAKYKYVASKNSKVFHKSSCSSAGRIKAANMTTYSSREEAINAGKRPCKRCKP